jgi:hypothetical protein
MQQPAYPIKVVFEEDGATWILNDEKELATTLEWFDSDAPDEHARVTDNQGRAVRIKVEKLELVIFELK